MGQLCSCCWNNDEYEPLNKSFNMEPSIGADRAVVESIVEDDEEAMKDPVIKAALESQQIDDIPLNQQDLHDFIQNIDKQ